MYRFHFSLWTIHSVVVTINTLANRLLFEGTLRMVARYAVIQLFCSLG